MCSPTMGEGFSLWSSIITNRERRIGTHALILSNRVFKLRRKSFIETHKIARLGKALIQQRNPGLYRYSGSVSLIVTGRRRWNVQMVPKSKILLADDHVLVAEGLQKLLESEFQLTGIVADGRALLKAVQEAPPDVAIVDISLPLLNGLDASRQILKLNPSVKIIILTMHAEPTFVTEAFRIGVSGYVLKQSVGSELVLAIKEVLKGNTYVSPTVAESLVEQAVHPSKPGVSQEPGGFAQDLSSRQREVLQLVAEGKSMKEVAAVLNVSIKTVEFHKTRIMRQLGLRTTAELTKYAIANGLISIQ